MNHGGERKYVHAGVSFHHSAVDIIFVIRHSDFVILEIHLRALHQLSRFARASGKSQIRGVIVPRYSSKGGKVAKAVTVPPERLASHHRNKPE